MFMKLCPISHAFWDLLRSCLCRRSQEKEAAYPNTSVWILWDHVDSEHVRTQTRWKHCDGVNVSTLAYKGHGCKGLLLPVRKWRCVTQCHFSQMHQKDQDEAKSLKTKKNKSYFRFIFDKSFQCHVQVCTVGGSDNIWKVELQINVKSCRFCSKNNCKMETVWRLEVTGWINKAHVGLKLGLK